MRLNILIYLLSFSFLTCDAFFLFKDKKEPFLFCYKVCPLYCPDLLHHRRSDDESVTYFDEDYPSKGYHEEEPSPAPKAYIYENTGHRLYTHIDHIPYPPYPDTHDYPDHASWVVEDKSHGRACHGCHGHHGSHSHHPWKQKPFELEYNVKYVFKPIYPTTTKKEPVTTEATTTKAPSTTPKELTGICYACLKKCDFYGYH